SGGTLALVTGVFEPLVRAVAVCASMDTIRLALRFEIRSLFRILPWKFLLSLGIGVLIAFASMARFFTWALECHPQETYSFFMGLVLASLIPLWKELPQKSWKEFLFLALGIPLAWGILQIVPMETPNNWYLSLISGAVAICAMILPGISGSFLLLVFGQYEYIWGAVADCARLHFTAQGLVTLGFAGAGAILALAVFVKLLSFLLGKYKSETLALLIGFMAGTLPRLWPYREYADFVIKKGKKVALSSRAVCPDHFTSADGWVLGAFVAGLVLVIAVELLLKRKNKSEQSGEDHA
ncbi:MAG: DUF368 domain-containing protein, partial [Victivallaceae bacterium]|nr:DUF368 domain-containing protein [Victivallaceae bacterium]